jgi:hypothetical protein
MLGGSGARTVQLTFAEADIYIFKHSGRNADDMTWAERESCLRSINSLLEKIHGGGTETLGGKSTF